MQRSPVLWSAQACPFRKAGVYYGLSPAATHVEVSLRLLPRRGQVYTLGSVTLQPSRTLPCVYLAVRDPSAVRVVPVPAFRNGAEHSNGHVSLIFPARATNGSTAATPDGPAVEAIRRYAADGEHAAFIVSVGLQTHREAEFHHQVLLTRPGLPYAELCERIESVKDRFSG
jgi:hypothetical protein